MNRIIKDILYWNYYLFHRYTLYLVIAVSVISYLIIGYGVDKHDFVVLMTMYGLLFATMFYFVHFHRVTFIFNRLLALAILFRLLFLFSLPELAENCYRLIWDGMLASRGINPYIDIPANMIEQSSILKIPYSHELFAKMQSKVLHSTYPPFAVLLSMVTVIFSPATLMGKVIFMRLMILVFDLALIYLGIQLLDKLRLSTSIILLYAFNPLVIIEGVGNLHIEIIMLFFFLLAIYFLIQGKLFVSAGLFSIATMVKLFVILFLPLFYRRLKRRKQIVYYGITLLGLFILFVPFMNGNALHHHIERLLMYFNHFEFNGGIYRLTHAVATFFGANFNPGLYGGIFWCIILMLEIYIVRSLRQKMWRKIFGAMLLVTTVFYLLAPVVYPWYLITLMVISLFTPYRYPVFWTLLIYLSYFTYYYVPARENMYVMLLEYLILLGVIAYELRLQRIQSIYSENADLRFHLFKIF